jgi:hypothetical protein
MDATISGVSGVLNCPGCQANLGAFSWIGGANDRCSCGFGISPIFKFYCSKTFLKRIKQT